MEKVMVEDVESDLELEVDPKTKSKTIWKKVGAYRFSKEIGRGAFSVVSKGYDVEGNEYAVKQISKAKLTAEQLKALKEEIRIMRLVKSEHIVKLYAAYQSKDNYYLILEYCSGGDLDSLVGKRLPESKIQQIISQLTKALKTLTDHSIMHRDLKLSNILISNDILKLADFGVARTLGSNQFANTFCGTPLYMAPEILAG